MLQIDDVFVALREEGGLLHMWAFGVLVKMSEMYMSASLRYFKMDTYCSCVISVCVFTMLDWPHLATNQHRLHYFFECV